MGISELYSRRYDSMSLKVLKIVTILAPAVFIGLFELGRHTVFVEAQPMTIGNLLVFVVVTIGAFFFSRIIFGIIRGNAAGRPAP